jgi:cytochrome c biogenesis protein
MAPEGTSFVIGDGLRRGGSVFAPRPAAAKDSVVVNDFTIEYLPNGQVSQFFSDLSVVDAKDGSEKQRKTISVNVPLRQGGVTMYQTDWEIASVRLRVLNEDDGGATAGAEDAALPGAGAAGAEDAASFAAKAQARQGDLGPAPETLFPEARADGDASAGETLSLPMANLEGVGNFQGRIWGAFLPLNPDASPGTPEARVGVSLLARDFQSVAAYASDGSFAGVRRPGSGRPIVVDGLTLVIDDVKGSTGLELKTDPGVPWVYAGFAGLMVTSFLSLLSHSQVWAFGEASTGSVHVGGRSNRAKEEFKTELDEVLSEVPEYR